MEKFSLDTTRAREAAYLVARGVRAMALVDSRDTKPETMRRMYDELCQVGERPAIPYVVDAGNGFAHGGYAAEAWVIDLYRWLMSAKMPEHQRCRIRGLLLGYSATAIKSYDDQREGDSGVASWPEVLLLQSPLRRRRSRQELCAPKRAKG